MSWSGNVVQSSPGGTVYLNLAGTYGTQTGTVQYRITPNATYANLGTFVVATANASTTSQVFTLPPPPLQGRNGYFFRIVLPSESPQYYRTAAWIPNSTGKLFSAKASEVLVDILRENLGLVNGAIQDYFRFAQGIATPSWANVVSTDVVQGLLEEPVRPITICVEADSEPSYPWNDPQGEGVMTGMIEQEYNRICWIMIRCVDPVLRSELIQTIGSAIQGILQSHANFSIGVNPTFQFSGARDCQYGFQRKANEVLAAAQIPWSCKTWYDGGVYNLPTLGTITPLDVDSCALWLNANVGTTLTGTNLIAWADQSGNGYTATLITGSAAPIVSTSAIGTYSAVVFGTNAGMVATNAVLSEAHHITVIGVFKSTNATVCAGAGYALTVAGRNITQSVIGTVTQSNVQQSPMELNTWRICRYSWSVFERMQLMSVHIDGLSAMAYSPSITTMTTGTTINFGLGSMQIAEMAVFCGDISDRQIVAVEAYLSNKYSL